jgi:hypothetical protein
MRQPEYKRTLHHINGSNNDIINAIESNFNKAVKQVSEDGWYKQFEGNTLKETCNNVWRFIKLNVPYQEDGTEEQKIKLPARTLADAKNGIGTDCKSFALLAAAILSKYAPVSFRYTSYRNDPTPTHVYCVVDGGRYIIDAVWKYPNSEKPYKFKYDHKMKISTLSGFAPEKKVKIDKHSFDVLMQLRNAMQKQPVGSPMYHKLQQQFNVVSDALALTDPNLPIGKTNLGIANLFNRATKKIAPKLKKAVADVKSSVSKKDKPSWASNTDYAKHIVKAVAPLFVEMRASFMLLLTVNYRDLCNRILAKEKSDPNSMARLWYVGFGGDPKALFAACEANKKKKALFGKPKSIHGITITGEIDDAKSQKTADSLTKANTALQSGGGDAAKAAALSASLGTAATAGAAALGLAGPQAAAVGAAAALAATIVATFVKHIGKDSRELGDPDASFDPNLDVDGDGIPDIQENKEESSPLLSNKTLLIGGAALVGLFFFMKKK